MFGFESGICGRGDQTRQELSLSFESELVGDIRYLTQYFELFPMSGWVRNFIIGCRRVEKLWNVISFSSNVFDFVAFYKVCEDNV